jgi:predicted nucleic acid-binding protein
LREEYSLSFWDSLIVSAAFLAGAEIIYSEDMQDGLVIRESLQVINPFKSYPK